MEPLEVTPSKVRETATALKSSVTAIAAKLEALEEATDHLRLEWEGEAQIAFDRAQTKARAQWSEHCEQLTKIAEAVTKLADEYGSTDRAAARSLGGQQ